MQICLHPNEIRRIEDRFGDVDTWWVWYTGGEGGKKNVADKLWKATERFYAKLLHGQRNPVALQQRSGKVLADVTSSEKLIAAEIKQSKNPPVKAIRKALAQAEAGKPASAYRAVAVFHQTGDNHDLDVVCMTLKTAKQLIPSFRDDDFSAETQ